ncbi:dermonecrotic toxin domain-containing protein [Pseudomonas gingeri]
MSNPQSTPATPTATVRSIRNHRLLLKQLPTWLAQAPLARRRAFATRLKQSQSSKALLGRYLQGFKSVKDFAAPLLSRALDEHYGPGLDIHHDQLRHVHILAAATLGAPRQESTLVQSLLQAALQNFESSETGRFGFDSGSAILRKSTAMLKKPITPADFAAVCRQLDLGGQYKQHVEHFLLPTQHGRPLPLFKALFEQQQRDELALGAEIALIQGHLDQPAYQMLQSLLDPAQPTRWDNRPVHCHSLSLLDFPNVDSGSWGALLKGVLLIEHSVPASNSDLPCVAYLAGDPQQAVKRYPSVTAFHNELRERLRDKTYQAFFQRYVHLRTQPAFFQALDDCLNPLDPASGQRKAAPQASLNLQKSSLGDSPFDEFCDLQTIKKLDDARVSAVPTDDEDKKTRLTRLHALLNWGINLLFLVPGLGEAMLAVAAAQMIVQLYNGIEEWRHDEKMQAVLGFIGVLLNVELLGAGTALTREVEGASFVEGLKPIQSTQGKPALWKPDLAPYEHPLPDKSELKVDANGLYHHQDKTYLGLDGRHYRIRPGASANRFHLQHPSNPDAYAPLVYHNGKGAWLHQFENPLQWQQPQLFSRLGPDAASLDPAAAQRIMRLSEVDDGILRRLHLDQAPPPALLEDSVTRFKLDQDLKALVQRLQSGGAANSSLDELHMELQLLTSEPVWPPSKVLRLLDRHGAPLKEYPGGQLQSLQRIDLQWPGLNANQLLQKVLVNLDESEIRSLLGEDFGAGPISLEARTVALRRKLATQATRRRAALFDSHYRYRTQSNDPAVALIRQAFPELSTPIAEELSRNASPAEQRLLLKSRRVPLRLAEEARYYRRNLRLARTQEGLYLDATNNPDADRLILSQIGKLPGWSDQVRLEIREPHFGGSLLDSLGQEQAPIRKVLVKTDGQYEAYDALGQELHGPDNLYSSVLHALPDTERKALGFPSPHEAANLKQAVLDQPLPPRKEMEKLLGAPPTKPNPTPPMRLAGRRASAAAAESEATQRIPGTRSLAFTELARRLYPEHPWRDVEAFLGMRGLNDVAAVHRLEELEIEYNTLCAELDAWVDLTPPSDVQRMVREFMAQSVKQCWRRELTQTPYGQAYRLSFVLYEPTARLPALSANFSHVSEMLLTLGHADITQGLNAFLEGFPQLKRLYISGGGLTEIPAALGSMSELTHLNLGGNQIVLTEESATLLGGLTRLREFNLSNNPTLGRLPDFSAMRELTRIGLRNTGLTQWPTGFTDLPALTHLDLSENELTLIPQSVLDTSEDGQRIARTLNLYGNPLEPYYLNDALDYHTETGIDLGLDIPADSDSDGNLSSDDSPVHSPQGSRPPASRDESPWLQGLDSQEQQAFRATWMSLASEEPVEQSEAFFRVIGDLALSADYKEADARPGLLDKVRRMVRGAAENTELREKLFLRATAPQSDACADGIAVAFSDMGFDVLLHEAYAEPDAQKIEAKLLQLARAKSRLDRTNAQARALIQKRRDAGRHPDEAEIYLAFRIGLAQRLELPWQASKMLFGRITGITPDQIEAVYQAILEQERQPMDRIRQIIAQEFWRDYLEVQYLQELSAKEALREAKSDALLDLQSAQERWFGDDALPEEEKTRLQAVMKASAATLGKPETEVFARVMTDAEYQNLYQAIAREHSDEMERLTAEALKEHGMAR